MDAKNLKKLYALLSKISNVFLDFYILKNGYILSMDIEKPFLIQIDDTFMELFEELCGKFKIVHVTDIRMLKKALKESSVNDVDDKDTSIKPDEYFYIVTENKEIEEVTKILTEMINEVNESSKWESFILSDDETENMRLIKSLFSENNYVNFLPKDNSDSQILILTKSLIPLVSEKNYGDLYYSSRKKSSDLFLIMFDIQLDLFRLYTYHYYVPIM